MDELPERDDLEPDDEAGAETFDETNLTADGRDIANFDDLPDVFDVTSAEGDEDEEPSAEEEPSDADLELERDEAGDDRDPGERPLRTRLETEPEMNALGDGTAEDEVEPTPATDTAPGSPTLADDEVTTEDRTNPNRFESRELSDEDLRRLGYRR